MTFWACSRLFQKVLLRHQGIQFRQPFLRAGDVKETSASAESFSAAVA